MKLAQQKTKPIILPFSSISQFYIEKFGKKIRTLPITIASTCPNRLGLKNMQTCIFCDEWGAAAHPEQQSLSVKDQIAFQMAHYQKRYSKQDFLVYFQAYTTSFLSLEKIKASIEIALSFPKVKGIILGTRPDCLSINLLNYLEQVSSKHYTSIELGIQSFFDHHLFFLKRGQTKKQSIDAIKMIKKYYAIDIGIHLIFGLPNETDQEIIKTAKIINNLPIDHVKLHNLHVLKNTPLQDLFEQGLFEPIDLHEYSRRVGLFISYLPKRIKIQRLAALSSHWDQLIAPQWTKYHLKSYQFIIDQLNENKLYQGQYAS